MEEKRMRGLVVAAITPMNEDGTLDEQGVASFTDFLCKAGVHCIYPNGTNGESLLLTQAERERVAEITVKASQGRTLYRYPNRDCRSARRLSGLHHHG